MPVAGGLSGFLVGGVFDVGWQVVVVGPHTVFVESCIMDEGGERSGELPFSAESGPVTGGLEEVSVSEMVPDGMERGVFFGDEGWMGHPEVPVTETVLPGHEGHAGGGAEGVGVERLESGAL